METNTPINAVITNGTSERKFKFCKCGKCGIIRMCTPYFNFETLENDPKGLLYCPKCLQRVINEHSCKF